MGTEKGKPEVESSMNDEGATVDEKLQLLEERAKDIYAFILTLTTLKSKLEKKKATIKEIISRKIEDNQKELKKWQELLEIVVDESLDEKIDKLESQATYYKTTHKEITQCLESTHSKMTQVDKLIGVEEEEEESDSENEDPTVDDLLSLELNLEPEGLTQTETTEMESRVKNDFNILLNEPKKSLRRSFTYIGGIIRGYLRRGKSNIDWIKIMRSLEGREFEDRMNFDGNSDPYVGTKLNFEMESKSMDLQENVSDTWNSMIKLFENRHDSKARNDFCQLLYKYYDRNPEDVEFYLPQLINLLLNQYDEFHPLRAFIMEKCSQSIHFALQTYLLCRASKDSREPPKKKKVIPASIIKWRELCNHLMQEIQNAVKIPKASSSSLPSPDLLTTEEVFHHPIQFMDRLVDVAYHLAKTSPLQYVSELKERLEEQNDYLKKLSETGAFVYIPMLKPVGSAEYHRVVRIPSTEGYPIPTYGRVLYYLVVEVIDEKKRHKRKKRRNGDNLRDSEDGSGDEKEPATKERPSSEEEREREREKESDDKSEKIQNTETVEKFEKLEKFDKKKKKKNGEPESKDKKEEDREKKSSTALKKTASGSDIISPAKSYLQNAVRPGSPTKKSGGDLLKNELGLGPSSSKTIGHHTGFGELWDKKTKRIKSSSPFGDQSRWRMQPLIVKSGEEVLQEEFAMQLIIQFQRIFAETGVPVKVVPYRILAVSAKAGLIEPIPNSLSLDKLKKQHTNLLTFFIQAFGETSEPSFKRAQSNFVKTMAAYSVICYLLQIKDRHNGNILLDASGHLVHIDFGYLLSKTIKFEKAPFKLTTEFVEVLGGYKSPCYKEYCRLTVKSFLAARKHYRKIMLLVEMTMEGKGKKVLPCLQGGESLLLDLQKRFHLEWNEEECEKFVMELVEEARGSWRTIVYDAYQLILNNIH